MPDMGAMGGLGGLGGGDDSDDEEGEESQIEPHAKPSATDSTAAGSESKGAAKASLDDLDGEEASDLKK